MGNRFTVFIDYNFIYNSLPTRVFFKYEINVAASKILMCKNISFIIELLMIQILRRKLLYECTTNEVSENGPSLVYQGLKH